MMNAKLGLHVFFGTAMGMGIRSILEDSPIFPCFFRFSLLMLCLCCKLRVLHMSRCVRKTKKGAAALLYFGSNTHTTQEESAESGRSDFTGTILFFHRYKITYDTRL